MKIHFNHISIISFFSWVFALGIVEKLTSAELMQDLKLKDCTNHSVTRDLIAKLLAQEEEDVACTFHKVSLVCPIGKTRMKVHT